MKSKSPITVCGSLSLHPVALGAAMHRAGYEALGLPFVYAPFALDGADLRAALDGMRALGIRGLGVSMPFKREVVPMLDDLDPLAARIGAVNTIVNDDRTLRGHNTDAAGAVRALEEARPVRGARCLVLGAGGAARAVVHGLLGAGASVSVANRDEVKSAALAREAQAEQVGWSEARSLPARFDVLVNATSVGMDVEGPSVSPVDLEGLDARWTVMDIVYKPLETALVLGARRRGANVVHGGRMLLHQAAAQFELYTGREAPLAEMDRALGAARG